MDLHKYVGMDVHRDTIAIAVLNARGADAFAIFTSVVRTLAKTSADSIVEGLLQVFRSAKMPDASAKVCH